MSKRRPQRVPGGPAAIASRRSATFLPLALALCLTSCSATPQRPGAVTYDAEIAGHTRSAVAPRAGGLRVMTLNIAHGRGDSFHQLFQSTDTAIGNLESIAALLRRETPDVTSLQEADTDSSWNGSFDHVDFLAERGDFDHTARGTHVDGAGLEYGTALLAKRELGGTHSVTFNPQRTALPKGFVVSTISWPGNDCVEVDVVSLHLDFARESVRREQSEQLIAVLRERDRPFIVTGDFNTEWRNEDSALRMIAQGLGLVAYRPDDPAQVTFPDSGKRLDWILVSPEIRFRTHRVVRDVVSDHFAVIADLEIDDGCSHARAPGAPNGRATF